MISRFRLPFRDDYFFSSIILLVLSVPIVFFMATYEKFETVKLALWYVLGGAALLVLLWQFFRSSGQKKILIHRPLFVILALLQITLLVSTALGGDVRYSIFGYPPRFSGSLLMMTLWLFTVVLLYVSLDKKRLKFLLQVVVFTSFLGSVVAILQSLGVAFYGGQSEEFFLRAPGLLGNANFSSFYIISVVPVSIVLLFQSNFFWSKLYYGVNLILAIAAAVFLSSRGSLLALFVELLAFAILIAFFKMGWRKLLAVLTLLFVTLGLWYVSIGQTRPITIAKTFTLEETNINLRFIVWDIARQAMLDHPLFGVGPSNFQLYFEQKRDKSLAGQNGVYDDAHNIFLQLGATDGNIFLGLFILLIGTGFLYGFRQAGNSNEELQLGIMAGTVGWLVAACFTPVPSACFLLLAIFLCGLYSGSGREINIRFGFRRLSFFAVLGIASIGWGATFFVGEILFFKAYGNYLSGNITQSLKEINLAIRYNPYNQLYYIYKAGGLAKLAVSADEVKKQVDDFIAMHKTEAHSYAAAANVYFAYYSQTREKIYLKVAIDYLLKSLQKDFFYAQRHNQLALYFFADNSLSNAMDYVKFSLSLEKNNIPGWLLLARLYQLQDRRDPIEASLKEALKLSPQNKYLQFLVRMAREEKDIKNINIPIVVQEGQLE